MTRGGSVYFCHDKQKDLMQGIFFFLLDPCMGRRKNEGKT